jgi:hypothetical protein
MEQLFGTHVVKLNPDKPQKPAEGHEEEWKATPDYISFPLEESILESTYIAVLFTAEYAPPAVSFIASFRAFCNEANKDPAKKKFEVVVVNCDRNQADYKTHIARMDKSWFNIPFDCTKVMERLEDVRFKVSLLISATFTDSDSLTHLFLHRWLNSAFTGVGQFNVIRCRCPGMFTEAKV